MKQNIGIEYLRVYASVSVIMIHVAALAIRQTANYSYEFPLVLDVLSRAAVPIFFMISGYLLLNPQKTLSFKTMWQKTWQRLLLPMLFWLVIYWLFSIVFYWARFQIATPLAMSREFFAGVTTYHFWFLPVLSVYYLLAPWLNEKIKHWHDRQLMSVIVASFIFGFVMQLLGAWSELFVFQFLKIAGFTGYFLFGYYVKRKQLKVKIPVGVSSYLLCMAITGLSFFGLYQVLQPAQTINFITDNFFPLIIIGSCLVFVSFVHQNYRQHGWQRLIVALSPYTFGVYFIHVAVLSTLASIGELPWAPMVSNPIILTVSVYAISLALSYGLKKNRWLWQFI